MERLSRSGIIDARGVTINNTLLGHILMAAPRDEESGRPRFATARFDGSVFTDEATFLGATFTDLADFSDASFEGTVNFVAATFKGKVQFGGATFKRKAGFFGAQFVSRVWFGDAIFEDRAWFEGATFDDNASFDRATFGDNSWFAFARFAGKTTSFEKATFGNGASFAYVHSGTASFKGTAFGDAVSFFAATFDSDAVVNQVTLSDIAGLLATYGVVTSFEGATFGDSAQFGLATFRDESRFTGATFGKWTRFGPLLGCTRLILDKAAFGQGSELAISADRLDCNGIRLPDGGALNIRWAEVRLDGAAVGQPTVIAGVNPFPQLGEDLLRPRVTRSWRSSRPRVLSLRGSDVRHLVFSNIDLSACRFIGTHNLDQLRLEGTIDFPDPPTRVRTGCALPPVWRWTHRRTLAEEHRWRRAQAKYAGWYPRPSRIRGLADQERSLQPADIASLYRALRKGREDSKDEPGSADFYYGEMEMRRHDRTAPWPERLVLALYWLVAGYGLRASRALGCLLVLLAVATVLLATVGFAQPPTASPSTATTTGTPPQQRMPYDAQPPPAIAGHRPLPDRLGTAALVAVEGAVFRTPDQGLTYRGRLIQATLRFVGPVLLGLVLLSIRGRVKR